MRTFVRTFIVTGFLSCCQVATAGDLGTRQEVHWYETHCPNVDVNRNTTAFRSVCEVKEFKYLGTIGHSKIYFGLYNTTEHWRPDSDAAKSVPREELDTPLFYMDITIFEGDGSSGDIEPVYFYEDEWILPPEIREGTSGRHILFIAGNGNKVRHPITVVKEGRLWSEYQGGLGEQTTNPLMPTHPGQGSK